jgi:plastocyanin
MIWLWRICFSTLCAASVFGASITGRVVLKDSREAGVKKRADFSGVVIALDPVGAAPVSPAAGSPKHAQMIQRGKAFVPHVLAIQVGTSVDFPNFDPIFHSAFSSYNGQVFDVGLYPPGSSKSVRFTRAGVVRVFCNIHSLMSAVIAVEKTPFFATAGRDGNFTIADVPAGEYELRVFHERATEQTLAALGRRIVLNQQPRTLEPIEISESGYLPTPHKNKFGRDYPPQIDEHDVYPAVRK